MNNKIQSIHLLRGIAGISVVLYHFKGYLNGVYAQKDLGQILFGSGAFWSRIFFYDKWLHYRFINTKHYIQSDFCNKTFF